MTITPHILAGAALASLLPASPASMKLVGFAVGFLSHYPLDVMPHWERLYGPHYNDELPGAYGRWPRHITFQGVADTFIGCAVLFTILAVTVPGPDKTIVFLGAAGAALPDLMDSVPWWSDQTKHWPVWCYLRRLHDWLHLDYDLQRRLPSLLGLVSQIAVIIAALLVLLRGYR